MALEKKAVPINIVVIPSQKHMLWVVIRSLMNTQNIHIFSRTGDTFWLKTAL